METRGWNYNDLHSRARDGGTVGEVEALLASSDGKKFAMEKDIDGYTPAHYAAIQIAYGDSTGEKLKLIVAACPACIDVQDNDGDTPLHNAAVNGDEKCIEVLISAGCNPLITNKGGKTAYDVAIERDYTASARMIKIHMEKCERVANKATKEADALRAKQAAAEEAERKRKEEDALRAKQAAAEEAERKRKEANALRAKQAAAEAEAKRAAQARARPDKYNCPPNEKGLVVIPNGATEIYEEYGFAVCKELKGVVFPNTITKIGASTFNNCPNLTALDAPDSVTEVGANAFGNCTNLASIVIRGTATKFGDHAFHHCPNLKSATISKSLNARINAADVFPAHTKITVLDDVNDQTLAEARAKAQRETEAKGKAVHPLEGWKLGYSDKKRKVFYSRKNPKAKVWAHTEMEEIVRKEIEAKAIADAKAKAEAEEAEAAKRTAELQAQVAAAQAEKESKRKLKAKEKKQAKLAAEAEKESKAKLKAEKAKQAKLEAELARAVAGDDDDDDDDAPGFSDSDGASDDERQASAAQDAKAKANGDSEDDEFEEGFDDFSEEERRELIQAEYNEKMESARAVLGSVATGYSAAYNDLLSIPGQAEARDSLEASADLIHAETLGNVHTNVDPAVNDDDDDEEEEGTMTFYDEGSSGGGGDAAAGKGTGLKVKLLQPKFGVEDPFKKKSMYMVKSRKAIAKAMKKVTKLLQRMAVDLDGMHKAGDPKDDKRWLNKARISYMNNLRRVTDIARQCLVCKDFAHIQAFLEMIDASDLRIIRIKNRFMKSNTLAEDTASYRDCQLLCYIPGTKIIFEIQLQLECIFELKEADGLKKDPIDGRTGHEKYTQYRNIAEQAKATMLLALKELAEQFAK